MCALTYRPKFAADTDGVEPIDFEEVEDPAAQIAAGPLRPEVIVSHQMTLEDAAHGCELFDKKEEDCRKVVLTPRTAARAEVVAEGAVRW